MVEKYFLNLLFMLIENIIKLQFTDLFDLKDKLYILCMFL